MSARPKGAVLYLGYSYYNNYYLSRALRERGWVADLVGTSSEGADQFFHGYDIRLDYTKWDYRHARRRADLLERVLRRYADALPPSEEIRPATGLEFATLQGLVAQFLKLVSGPQRWTLHALRAAIYNYDIFHFTGVQNLRFFYYFNPQRFGSMPIGWDIRLLRRMGKRIVYSNSGCLDGVTQSRFRLWGPEPVCDICRWRDDPSVCSDERNHAWGRLRNSLVDYQIAFGGNRADYNDDPRVHEVPEFYCLDPTLWNPDLLIPSNYRLPFASSAVKIYHAVGNYDSRSDAATRMNIKSTHIYLPLIDRLKGEGYDVELIFFQDVPNKQLRYYQAQADIVVDMLTFGFFGANVREALMMGKPVVCFLRPEWMSSIAEELPDFVAEMPIVSATPATVHDVLRDLIEHPEKRRELGRRGRAFALKWFSAEAGGRRLDAIYSNLLGLAPEPGSPAPLVRATRPPSTTESPQHSATRASAH